MYWLMLSLNFGRDFIYLIASSLSIVDEKILKLVDHTHAAIRIMITSRSILLHLVSQIHNDDA